MSNTTISEYADNALLSEAAYADFKDVVSETDPEKKKEKIIDALKAEGFSATQAADFVIK